MKSESDLKTCPECGQKLRIPSHVGGLKMKCPTCGHEFSSDFKIGASPRKIKQSETKSMGQTIFELPTTILNLLFSFFKPRH
ncbi:MAG: hypothetical protein D6B25_07420 [Desulfobulbaceae bacterium]|nr:MAG: hypothetical protein D6B25_07420 [Desulfobulbaceae bacterium]